MRTFLFLFFLTLLTNLSFGQSEIPKSVFFKMITTHMPSELCKNPLFKLCLKHVTGPQCHQFMVQAVKKCSDDIKGLFPEVLDRQASVRIGREVGSCAGRKYQMKFDKNPRETNACIFRNFKKR